MPHIQETDTIFGHGGQGPENTHTNTQTHLIIINHIRVFRGLIFSYVCEGVVTRVTEQQTGVSTGGFELLLTDGATGVRSQPGVSWRILHLPTVTHVSEHNTTCFY